MTSGGTPEAATLWHRISGFEASHGIAGGGCGGRADGRPSTARPEGVCADVAWRRMGVPRTAKGPPHRTASLCPRHSSSGRGTTHGGSERRAGPRRCRGTSGGGGGGR